MTNHYWDRVTAPHADRDGSDYWFEQRYADAVFAATRPADATEPPAGSTETSEGQNAGHEREQRYAEAIHGARPAVSEVATPSTWLTEARAVMAVADDELAEKHREIERLREGYAVRNEPHEESK